MKDNVKRENPVVIFGEFVKSLRKQLGKTARITAIEAGMQPSNYCRLEYGALKPPQDKAKLDRLINALNIPENSPQRARFYDMAAAASNSIPLDLAEIISKDDAVPLMLRTITKKKLSQREVDELVKLVRGKSD